MNRDFEFRQLLRAYRAGIIGEQAFEGEMAELERSNGASANGGAGTFHAFGKTYNSEREAIVAFLDRARAGEANAGVAFAKWAEACKTDCIRSGVRMIAERESFHGRVFEQRMRDLGAECHVTPNEDQRKFAECLADPNLADNEKLLRIAARVPNPDETLRPICEFAELIKEDLETKEALKLFYEDELSSTKWLLYACGALNAPQPGATARPSA
jgi:hypothetical protein